MMGDFLRSAISALPTVATHPLAFVAFHLFFHRSLFHTIPKRCFEKAHDIAGLRALLKRSLGNKADVR
jgi:hypothetical protein